MTSSSATTKRFAAARDSERCCPSTEIASSSPAQVMLTLVSEDRWIE